MIIPLRFRVLFGLSALAILAVLDFRKFGRESRRIREYGFVLAKVLATALFAAIHDLLTSSISPEYFIAGKGLAADHIRLRAMWLGAQAALAPGALLGVSLTIANNPSKRLRQLSYRTLFGYFRFPIIGALSGALVLGLCGFFDLRNLTPDLLGSIESPQRFLVVWGIHWGTYIGGFCGLCVAVVYLRKGRQALQYAKPVSDSNERESQLKKYLGAERPE
jgi:hypothetical protein